MNRILTAEKVCELLGKSRTEKNRSQKYMAKALGKSIGTIQNWEYGLSTPTVLEFVEWFEVLGIHPLRYVLNMLHPDVYENLGSDADYNEIYVALDKYVREMATSREIRQIAFGVFGQTGSSWHSQMNMVCALNHLPIMDRINIAESILNLYEIRKSRNELRCTDHIMPDTEELKLAITLCKEATIQGKDDYSVK